MANKLRGVGAFPGQMAENSVSSEYLEKRMLFKKTLKVVLATALWMVALVGANSAMAQEFMGPIFSAEALGASTSTTMARHAVASSEIDVTVAVGERVAYLLDQGRAVHFRAEGNGVLVLTAAPTIQLLEQDKAQDPVPEPALTGSATTMSDAAGDGWRQGYTSRQEDIVQVRVTAATASVLGMGPGGIMVTAYSGDSAQDDAHFGEGTPRMEASGTALMVKPSVEVKAAMGSPSRLEASAATRFTQFRNDAGDVVPTVSFGGFDIQVTEAHLDPAGNTLQNVSINSADGTFAVDGTGGMATEEQIAGGRGELFGVVGISPLSGTKFYGDGGFDFASGFALMSGSDCSGDAKPAGAIRMSPVAEEEDDQSDDVSTAVAIDPWYLCVTVDAENESTIAQGDYLMDVNLTPAEGDMRPFPPMSMSGLAVANIDHDGTTVQIPYVTTYEQYNQRIVIVNRTKDDVGYSITFSTEDGVTATPGMAAEGMTNGGATTVLKAVDVVTIEGGTRASAEVILLADPSMVDVATQVVNKMGGGTDTVVLESR